MVGITSVVGEKGQVTIPKPLRDLFGLRPGDKVEFDEKNREIVLRRRPRADPAAIAEAFRAKYGPLFTKQEFKHADWDALYEEQLSERGK
ncbi:AbrB/MazE/SpoVT family DNA-binding domain-containing protein [Candidatus Woesearchaeota archaeon]|nr:AbrB/MazE/SpoVT family DNA-binding domain-containing protein [Candidatus Woesearchaeota archaeon]